MSTVLDIVDLKVAYGDTQVLSGASLSLEAGELLGLVGESGSGKSTLVQGALRLLPFPAQILGGRVLLDGVDLLALSHAELRRTWWDKVALVPQNALSALNPMLTLRAHFNETLRAHGITDSQECRRRAEDGMRLVELSPERLNAHPHMLSGGMRQRVAIALAMVLKPEVIVFDEPTTALDVVVERQILDQIAALRASEGFGAIFITHDLRLLQSIADRIAVLYAGQVVEDAPAGELGGPQSHPYTRGLLAALPPRLDENREAVPIPGAPPRVGSVPYGCAFSPRCAEAIDACTARPPLTLVAPSHHVACVHATPSAAEAR